MSLEGRSRAGSGITTLDRRQWDSRIHCTGCPLPSHEPEQWARWVSPRACSGAAIVHRLLRCWRLAWPPPSLPHDNRPLRAFAAQSSPFLFPAGPSSIPAALSGSAGTWALPVQCESKHGDCCTSCPRSGSARIAPYMVRSMRGAMRFVPGVGSVGNSPCAPPSPPPLARLPCSHKPQPQPVCKHRYDGSE